MEEYPKHIPFTLLMTTDTVGGVWSYSMELCRVLLPYNVRVILVTTGAPMQPSQKQEAGSLPHVTLFETEFRLEWMEDPWEDIRLSGEWLLQLEEKVHPDLVHLNTYAYGALAWKAPVVVVAHSDVWSWWYYVKNGQPPAEWNHYFEQVQSGLQKADYLVAPSLSMMSQIRGIYKVDTPGTVIYNARNPASFGQAKKLETVFSMGRIWDEAKNIGLLVDAAPHIPYEIKVAGDNSFETNRASTPGANITYLGKLSPAAVAGELAAAAIFVLPAKYEPFGLAALEAALSGCALVLGNIDSLKEIWGDSAHYVDTNDAHALAGTVNLLMQDEALRAEYAGRAAVQAERYTLAAFTINYLAVYRHLLQQFVYKKELV